DQLEPVRRRPRVHPRARRRAGLRRRLFEHIGVTPRNGVAAITAQGRATSWNANVNLTGQVNALQVAGTTVYLGGSFDTLAGQSRVDLAAAATSSGALLPWAPNTSPPFGTVQTLAATGNT